MKPVLKREEIDSKYKWNLKLIYENDDLWEVDFNKVKLMDQEILKFRGILGESAQNLLDCLKLRDKLNEINDRVWMYARFKRDEDCRCLKYQELLDRANVLETEVLTNTSFIIPEIFLITNDELNNFIKSNEELVCYKKYFEQIIRNKEYNLSDKEEKIVALANNLGSSPRQIFETFINADLKFENISNKNGGQIEISNGNFLSLLENDDRNTRRTIFNSFYNSYNNYRNTLASIFSLNVKKNIFFTKARKYDSAIEYYLDVDNIPVCIYDNLIDEVSNNLGVFHKYFTLRKKILKLDKLHIYDTYIPLVKDVDTTVNYDDAVALARKGLLVLGEEYNRVLGDILDKRLIDVFQNEGKISGCYTHGTYSTHPYILLNYKNEIRDVFYLVHELGHAVHTHFSIKNQPYIYSNYSPFVAEVASQVNESLLANYLINNTKEKAKKAFLIIGYLERFRRYLFKQTMLAEFEKIVHCKEEAGESLSAGLLCEIYHNLNVKYFGEDVIIDKEMDIEWATIPHFYKEFYVYKYATGFLAATEIAKKIISGDENYIFKYIDLLSGGNIDYPIDALLKVGVDLTILKSIKGAFDVFEDLLCQLESLLAED